MRVAFLQKDPLPDPLLMSLGASVLLRGHQARCFLPRAERDLRRALRAYAPGALIFHVQSGFSGWALEQGQRLRHALGGCPVAFTGPLADDHPELLDQDGVDLLLLGDAEETLSEVLWRLGREKTLPGTAGTLCLVDGDRVRGPKRERQGDLGRLPLPDLQIYKRYPFLQELSTLHFATGRGRLDVYHEGGSMDLLGLRQRFRSTRRLPWEQALMRLHLHCRRREGYRRVDFRDDSFVTAPRPWMHSFLERYREEIDLPFACSARPEHLDDEALVTRLVDAGCDLVRLEVVSGDPALRAQIAPKLGAERLRRVCALLKSKGVRLHLWSYLGLPGETLASATATLDLNRHLRPDQACVIPMARAAGCDGDPKWTRLARLAPLVHRAPALRGLALRALGDGGEGAIRRLCRLHHDASFVGSGQLSPRDLLRIAWGMR